MKTALLALTIAAALALPACTLTPEQKAKIQLAEQQGASLGDKLLKVGVMTGYITPAEADKAREIGAVIVSQPAPAPTAAPVKIETTSGK